MELSFGIQTPFYFPYYHFFFYYKRRKLLEGLLSLSGVSHS